MLSFVLVPLILYGYILACDAAQTNHTRCRDIHETCQELAIKGHCHHTDFVRHFCPISCRNPNCTDYFPSFTSKSTHWRQLSSTTCHYSNLKHDISPTLYFKHRSNISLNQCQNECDRNPLCTHIIYIKDRILAQTPINPYLELLSSTALHHHALPHNKPQYDNITLHICIHSYLPFSSCHPICLDSDTLHLHLLNHKQDINTQTHTAQLLHPFIFSTVYEYISPYSLYIKENRAQSYWQMVNEFNTKHKVIPYQSHEYYYPQRMEGNAPPMLEAPKLNTYAGTTKVRLEFESRVSRVLEVSWMNTRNDKEYFQDTLEANTWSVSKARNSFNGHVFVIRDSVTKQWITTYRNNPSHTNVFITITPYGVCVRDEPSSIHSIFSTLRSHSKEANATQLLRETDVTRWGSNANLLNVWRMYEDILWMTSRKQTIAKVLNLMGQIFLFGSYDEIFDYNIAWSYFKVAAAMGGDGSGDAMYNMAFMIEKKLLPAALYHTAPKSLYRIAMLNYWCSAQSHSAKAQLLLGFRYLNGIATNKSCFHSVFFYEKLARQVRYDARSLDKYVEVIDLADPPPTTEDLNMDEHQIRYYKQYAAMGRAWANNHLGQVYLFGLRGIAQDYELAAQHFEAAANANDPIAANYLGRLYWNGLGRKRDLNKTRQLFTFAAQRNVSQAQNNLAFMSWKGIGTKRNMTQALKWFKRAAAQGFAQAMFYLGEIYKTGDSAQGVAKNISMAVEYYISATKRRHYRSMYELGMLYRDGVGVDRNCEKAVALFKYVAEYHDVKFELEHARTAYEEARYAESYVIYSQKAEEGYINGQTNAAFLATNGYHAYLYDVSDNPFYDALEVQSAADDTIKMKKKEEFDDIDSGECHNNNSIFADDDDDICIGINMIGGGVHYVHQVLIPENKELAFRYYSLAASQNHSRSLRVLGDYYWYEWPPIHLFSYFSSHNVSDEIDEYDQRSMALSIAYLSTPHSIVQYSNIIQQHEMNRSNATSINAHATAAAVVMENMYLLRRHEVIACYLYELASLQATPKVDAQSLYDFAYCFEHGRGRERNISKARQLYWIAINKSSEAWIPVFLTLLRMEATHLYHVSDAVVYNKLENMILMAAFAMLTMVLCIKLTRDDVVVALDTTHLLQQEIET